MSVSDFGRYLQSVMERDIDLFLMEEFHIDPRFVAWFAGRVELGPSTTFDGAWHSLCDDGQTDLLLRVRFAEKRIAILIENKVAAPEQEEQDIRYLMRGARAQDAGRYDRFVIAICAPQIYLDSLSEDSAYQHRVSYEALRDWYSGQSGARAAWRQGILSQAIEQGRRGYVMKVHAGRTDFHFAYWEHICTYHPELTMVKPGPKGKRSNWIRFRVSGLPKDACLVHKMDQDCVDLIFGRTQAAVLARQREQHWPEAVRILPRGNSAALSLQVPHCDPSAPFPQQVTEVEGAISAAIKLLSCIGLTSMQ